MRCPPRSVAGISERPRQAAWRSGCVDPPARKSALAVLPADTGMVRFVLTSPRAWPAPAAGDHAATDHQEIEDVARQYVAGEATHTTPWPTASVADATETHNQADRDSGPPAPPTSTPIPPANLDNPPLSPTVVSTPGRAAQLSAYLSYRWLTTNSTVGELPADERGAAEQRAAAKVAQSSLEVQAQWAAEHLSANLPDHVVARPTTQLASGPQPATMI